MIQSLQHSRVYQHFLRIGDFLPVLFFFGGFIWDALTIGRNVGTSDLVTFMAYLLFAGLTLFIIGRPSYVIADTANPPRWLPNFLNNTYRRLHLRLYYPHLPYFLLQFVYGNLLSSLFILYFKSANHWLAWLMTIIMAGLLVGNEFIESEYRRFTLSWAVFGLCAMLVFNFVLPSVLGSIHAVWFYLSTVLGALAAHGLYRKTPNHLGSIFPVWIIASLLMFAYLVDMIPPVPLVKRDIAMAYAVQKVGAQYQLSQQASSWWVFWRQTSDDLTVAPNQRAYCFSSIFAPAGLSTTLFHNWQIDTKKGWVTQSRASFKLSGGRYGGYRVYTFKNNIAAGDWRVSIETEDGKTLAIHAFTVEVAQKPAKKVMLNY